MRKILKTHIYILVNSASILAIIIALGVNIKLKNYNLHISEEIKYMSAKIAEQDNYLKIFKSELSLITSPESLVILYQAYYQRNINDFLPNVKQIKRLDHLAKYLDTQRFSRLNGTYRNK